MEVQDEKVVAEEAQEKEVAEKEMEPLKEVELK